MNTWARWRLVGSGLLGGLLAVAAGQAAQAQQPTPAVNIIKEGNTLKTFTNKTTFFLPVKIHDHIRANLREVDLYVKVNHGDWVRQETGLPTQEQFTYRATQEGEYWFSLVTVDRAGKVTPADLNQAAPNLKVIVDTHPPHLELQPQVGPDGELFLRCLLQDANPDYQNLRISYHGADQQEHVVVPVPSHPGLFRLDNPDLWATTLKVSAVDRCGNGNARHFTLREVTAAAGLTPPPTAAAPTVPQMPHHAQGPIVPVGHRTEVPVVTAPVDLRPVPQTVVPAQHQTMAVPTPQAVLPAQHQTMVVSTPPAMLPASLPTTVGPDLAEPKAPAANVSQASAGNRQLVTASPNVAMDYRIDQVGPSGVGKVEVWITKDRGTTWSRLCEDNDHRSPAEIILPGEGLYGLRLVITNGNGFGGTPPQRGDQPASWIEMDTTPPQVQLREVELIRNGGLLELRWAAQDRNLGPSPVTLLYSGRREGPWQVIARNLKYEGSYRWSFPRDGGGRFYLRVEAADQAGNAGWAETNAPISFDMTEPRGQVLGVSAIQGRPAPAP